MHPYTLRPIDTRECPRIEDYRFLGPVDVVRYVEDLGVIDRQTWPEVWHLDDDGEFQCYYRASSLCSMKRWAENTSDLRRSRREGLASSGCAHRWLIIEPRVPWLHDRTTANEGDVQDFLTVRRKLRSIRVQLIDAVIFDGQGHWWSMHELTTGGLLYG